MWHKPCRDEVGSTGSLSTAMLWPWRSLFRLSARIETPLAGNIIIDIIIKNRIHRTFFYIARKP